MGLTPDDLAKMLGHMERGGGEGRRKKRRPHDSVAFPANHVAQLMQMMQEIHELPPNRGKGRSIHALWQFIHKVLPITRGRVCDIDGHNATVPFIKIFGPVETFNVGDKMEDGRKILSSRRIPDEHMFRVMELSEMEDGGPLHRYNFWKFLGEIFPDLAMEPTAKHTYVSTAEFVGVVTTEDGEDGEED